MSNNCLVTRLKSSVDNENLEYFDAVQVEIDLAVRGLDCANIIASGYIYFGGIGATIRVVSNGVIKKNNVEIGQEYTLLESDMSATVAVYPVDVSNPVVGFCAFGLSKINHLYVTANNIAINKGVYIRNPKVYMDAAQDAMISTKGTRLSVFAPWYSETNTTEDFVIYPNFIEKITDPSLVTELWLTGFETHHCGAIPTTTLGQLVNLTNYTRIDWFCQPYGDIANLRNLTYLIQVNLRQPFVYGDITVGLGKMTSMTLLNINDSLVSGSIEELVASLYENGKKSASGDTRIHFYSFNATHSVTYRGEKLIVHDKYLAWDDGGSAPTNIRFENS